MGKTTEHFTTVRINEVMAYFAKDFDGDVVDYSYWIDTNRGEVVFRLHIANKLVKEPSEETLVLPDDFGDVIRGAERLRDATQDVILTAEPIEIVEPEQPTVVIAGQPRDETFLDAMRAGRANEQMQLIAPTSQETARFAQRGYTITKRWRVKLIAPHTVTDLQVGFRYVADNLEGADPKVAVYYRGSSGTDMTALISHDTFHEIFEIEDTLEP